MSSCAFIAILVVTGCLSSETEGVTEQALIGNKPPDGTPQPAGGSCPANRIPQLNRTIACPFASQMIPDGEWKTRCGATETPVKYYAVCEIACKTTGAMTPVNGDATFFPYCTGTTDPYLSGCENVKPPADEKPVPGTGYAARTGPFETPAECETARQRLICPSKETGCKNADAFQRVTYVEGTGGTCCAPGNANSMDSTTIGL
jgi:hypothetical protein